MSIPRPRKRRAQAGGFHPPHCPNKDCTYYNPELRPQWSYRSTGPYVRASDERSFPAFQCRHCKRYFSSRTFSATYWLRYRSLFPKIVSQSVNAPGLRQVGRILGVTHATVGRHLARAGRHCLLLHRQLVQPLQLTESLVVDGFETFEYSQFFPFHINLAVGSRSWFLYHFTDSPLRRKGTMTARQKKIREELEARLGRPDPKAVETGMVQLLSPLLRHVPAQMASVPEVKELKVEEAKDPTPEAEAKVRKLILHSDDHRAYPRALKRLHEEGPKLVIEHRVTSSKERRTTSNPLFPVNLADLLLRHSEANHRRETIAFSKRRQGAIERLAVFTVWRNLVKRRREKKEGETAAMLAGLATEPWTWDRVFRGRRFVRKELLPDVWWEYYWRQVKTTILGDNQTVHELKYAF